MAQRKHLVRIPTTDEELKIIKDKAEKNNLAVATWLRKLALESEVK